MNRDQGNDTDSDPQGDQLHYTARHLLHALEQLDEQLLDLPVVLIYGRSLQKPNLVRGFLPSPTPVDLPTVEAKHPALLTLGELVDMNGPDTSPDKRRRRSK